MGTAHLFMFSDACPSDWLVDGQEETWHTIVNFIFPSDPHLWPQVAQGLYHEDILASDTLYQQFMAQIQSELPSGKLNKWKTGPGYRERFCKSIAAALPNFSPRISAFSFQEKVLRASKNGIFNSYNERIGGVEGRGIGFEESVDARGRRYMKHSFINFHGHHEIVGLENQMLVLLFMAWCIADQYAFYFHNFVNNKQHDFDNLHISVISDKLSGDDDFRAKSEENLRHLVDPDVIEAPLTLSRSKNSDAFSGDLFVDNLAGWLNAVLEDTSSQAASYARAVAPTGFWKGWNCLEPSTTRLVTVPATKRI